MPNPHEERARAVKAHKLAHVVTRTIIEFESDLPRAEMLAGLPDAPVEFRERVARLAKVKDPSDQTWEIVAAMVEGELGE